MSLTFQGSNARTLQSTCGNFAYVGGGAYSATGFSGSGVQGGNVGYSAGLGTYPGGVEHGTSDTRVVWVPGDGGNQCNKQ